MSLNDISWTTGPNSKLFHRNVPHDALCQNGSEHYALLNNMATRAKNRNIFKSYLFSHRPINHLPICQDSNERSRALGPSSLTNYASKKWVLFINRTVRCTVNVLKFQTLVASLPLDKLSRPRSDLFLKKQYDQDLPCLLFWHEFC